MQRVRFNYSSRVTNRKIVQPSQSQVVQLYASPNLHIYKRKLKIKYFLSLGAYKNQYDQK